MRLFKMLLCSILLFVSGYASLAQITVDNSVTPAEAMQTLLGANVTISNLQFSGFNEQIGTFDCIDCGLDFSQGIILSSGDVDTALGPNNNGSNSIGGIFEVVTDVDLNQLATLELHDLCVLEFDFVALGDTVTFDFTWASDEYPEFTTPGSDFNDVFGFFISGPGIAGPYSNASENMALIPGTDMPVTIQNVNNGIDGLGGGDGCVNCEYYVHNGNGWDGPEVDDETVIGYDGYTSGLTAIKGGLVCGETYHLKLAIADAGDNGYDSAVILKAGSLTSNLTVQVELEIETTTSEGVMNEECGLAILNFIRPTAISSNLEFVVEVAYGGDAVNGVDYTAIPADIVFDPGVDTITFVLDAFEDGLIEGMESVQFEMLNLAVCQGTAVPSYFEFFITESSPLEIEGYDQIICDGATTTLAPIVLGGSGGFVYDWSTMETTSTIDVAPANFTTYSVEVSDTCLASVSTAFFDVDVAAYPALTLNATPANITIDCNWFGEFFTANAGGGDGNYTYDWIDEDGNSVGFGANFNTFDNGLNSLIARVTDGCGIQTEQVINITTNVTPLVVELVDTVYTCPGLGFELVPVIEGEAPFFISWFDNSNFTFLGDGEILDMDTDVDMQIQFSISDNCGQFFNQNVEVIIASPEPLVINAGLDVSAECEEIVTLTGDVISGTAPYSYSWDTSLGVEFSNTIGALYTAENTGELTFTVSDACGEEASDNLLVEVIQIPLEITVPLSLQGDCLNEFEITATTNQPDLVGLNWAGSAGMDLVDNYNVTYQSLNSGTITVSADIGCGNTDSKTIDISISSPPLEVTSSPDVHICPNESTILSVTASGGSGAYVYFWEGEASVANTFEAIPSYTSVYEVEVQDECLNRVSDQTQVTVEDLQVGITYTPEEFNIYSFTPVVIPACDDCSYFWEFNDGGQSSLQYPNHTFSTFDGFETFLTVTSPTNCLYQTDQLIVFPLIYIPNSFTPNGDQLNDVFKVQASGITQYEISIFNRWGDLVYTSTDHKETWDGSHMKGDYFVPNGMYSFVLKYKSGDTQAKEEKGHISLFR